jgi:hypothetical protein
MRKELIAKYKQFKNATLIALMCVLSAVIIPATVKAHNINETSAQVILRDGQVEVRVITDREHLVSVLQSNQAWLMGDIDEIMPTDLSDDQQVAFIKKALKQAFSLSVNQQKLTFDRVEFEVTDSEHEHGAEIVFQARHSFSNVADITISFPKSLGSVHASFVKPQYKLLNAGDATQIVF